jgi:hypothetical protein
MEELRHEHLGVGATPDPANTVRGRLQAGYEAVVAGKPVAPT